MSTSAAPPERMGGFGFSLLRDRMIRRPLAPPSGGCAIFSRRAGTLPSENIRAKARISTRSSMSARCSSRLIGSSPSGRCRHCFCPKRDVTASTTMRRCFAPTSKAATTSFRCAALIGRPDAWSSCGRTNTSRTSFRSMDIRHSLSILTASCCRHQKPACAGPHKMQRPELDRNSFEMTREGFVAKRWDRATAQGNRRQDQAC